MLSFSHSSQSFFIINCDDFGWNSYRDSAILSLFESKDIKSSSVLINGYNSKFAISQAKILDFPLGLHINFTEGLPIRTDLEKNTLLKKALFQANPNSKIQEMQVFHGKFEFFERIKEGSINKEHILKEIQAQVNEKTSFLLEISMKRSRVS